jgi:hypothetical protein
MPGALVQHFEHGVARLLVELDRDEAHVRRILHRVGQQVVQDDADLFLVAVGGDMVEVQLDTHTLRDDRELAIVHDAAHHVAQLHDLRVEIGGLRVHGAVVEQALDQLPQLDRVLLQDARDLALLRVQVSHHARGKEVRSFAKRGERGLQLVRDVLQEARLLRFQRHQALAQPVELRSQAHHVAGALDPDGLGELALAQGADSRAHLRDGAGDEVGEGSDQCDGRGNEDDHQPEHAVAGLDRLRAQLFDPLVDDMVAQPHQPSGCVRRGGRIARATGAKARAPVPSA